MPTAKQDVETIDRRLAEESPSTAAKLVEDLVEAAESLATLSNRDRRVPELRNEGYRELLIRDCPIVYRVSVEEVTCRNRLPAVANS